MPADLAVDELALAGVEAGAHLEAELAARASTIAQAQRMARAGPSKAAKKPSPAVSISRPRKRASSRADHRVMALEESRQARSPSSAARRWSRRCR